MGREYSYGAANAAKTGSFLLLFSKKEVLSYL